MALIIDGKEMDLTQLIKPYLVNIPKNIELEFFNNNRGLILVKKRYFGLSKSNKKIQITIHHGRDNFITIGFIGSVEINRIEDVYIDNFESVFHSYLDAYVNFNF